MKRAKYVGKHRFVEYGVTYTELEYEYRGKRYTVQESSKGNELLSWQHRSAQAAIDRELDIKTVSTEPAQVGFDLFMDFVNGKE